MYIKNEIITKVAKAYNNLDYKEIELISSDDLTYTSQSVLTSLKGKIEVLRYLKEKFKTIKNSNNKVFAEIARMGSQQSWSIQIVTVKEGDLCVLISQGTTENKGGIILVDIDHQNLIKEINICTVVPHWTMAIGTGVYPA